MLRTLRSRRRPQYGTHLCAAVSAVLLLLSVTVLHSRLGSDRHQQQRRSHSTRPSKDLSSLLQDAVPETPSDDRIDELDVVDDSFSRSASSDEDEILRGAEMDDDGDESDQSRVSPRFYFDHIVGVIRRPFDRRSIDKWEDYASFDAGSGAEDLSKGAFGSDDVAVDEEVRRRVLEVSAIEDALLLKVNRKGNPLREGWGPWFDKKGDFLRRDRMFRSNLDLLNPQNNPMLQDPDGVGVTGLTRGDKLVQKLLMNEFKKVPFSVGTKKGSETNVDVERRRSEIKRAERRTLDDNASSTERSDDASSQHYNRNLGNSTNESKVGQEQNVGSTEKLSDLSIGEGGKSGLLNSPIRKVQDTILADGNRWGYFPGLHPHLSFSEFMDAYFREGMCHMRVFMIWNSPSWMYLVRHQRGLESLLFHHRDACVVVFSETIELDFFKDFVKDCFKVAVAMPNLDELLKDTPTHIFSSVWFEWRKTKFYATHYSELVRLAALYKFGGIYLDADIILLKPLPSLNNSVGMEDQVAGVSLNGAVMAFRKHSPFIMECLTEFHSTYDDTRLRWNGADLLTRVSRNFLDKENIFKKHLELEVQPSVMFFPINSGNITRYFSSPATEGERAQQDVLFRRILNESFTFHFWNSLTYALAPERESLVARLIDRTCIHCFDVL